MTHFHRRQKPGGRGGAGVGQVWPTPWVLVLAGALSVSCLPSFKSEVPSASNLLRRSSEALNHVTSARFSADVEGGNLTALPLKKAEGVVTADGQAWTKVRLVGNDEHQFSVKDGKTYVRAPSGEWRLLPQQTQDYNPSELIDPNFLQRTLARATSGSGTTPESVRGTPAYRVQAELPTDSIRSLTRPAPSQRGLPAKVWLERSSNRPLRLEIKFSSEGSREPTILTLNIFDFDDPGNESFIREMLKSL